MEAMVNGKTPILIVDDHPVVRQGLALVINNEPDMRVCGDSADGTPVLGMIAKLKPKALILDLSLRDMNGFDLLKDIHRQYPRLPVLVLSMHEEAIYAERALRAGAMGYINKEEMLEKVVLALRQILKEEVYASESVKTRVIRRMASPVPDSGSPTDRLSNREIEVFRLIGMGYSTRAIAEKWNRSVKTVETYRANIKRKLELVSSADLVREAVRWLEDVKQA